MSNTRLMNPCKKGFLFFLLCVGVANLLPVILSPLIPFMQINVSPVFYMILYYVVQLLDCLLLFFGVGVTVTVMSRRGFKTGMLPLAVMIAFKALSSLISTFLSDTTVLWYIKLLSVLSQALLYAAMYIGLSALLYFFFLSGTRNVLPALWGIKNPFFLSNLITAIIFFLYRTAIQIYDTIVFIEEDLFGIPELISPNEVASIVFDYVFILLSIIAAYFLMWYTEKKTLDFMQE